jgi:ABC-type transport system involved in multi-copper enzyme maturation permease subunit
MTTLIRTEVLKLRTARSTWGLLLAGFALAALLGAATTGTAGQDGAAGLGRADNLANVLGVSALPGALMLVLGILAMAGEYQHRTITQTFLVTPVRGRVVAAKLAAAALVGVPVAAAVMAVALGTALPRIWVDGATVDLVNRTVAETVAGNLLAGALLGVLGVSVGALLRNQLAAVLLAIAWGLIGEGILSVFVGQEFARWLPGGAAQAVISGGEGLLPLWGAALLLAAYSAAGALAASRLTVRRDIA